MFRATMRVSKVNVGRPHGIETSHRRTKSCEGSSTQHRGYLNECPLYHQKLTLTLASSMSALCQKQTFTGPKPRTNPIVGHSLERHECPLSAKLGIVSAWQNFPLARSPRARVERIAQTVADQIE